MTEDDIRAANPDRPRIYDISTDTFRFATQHDLDCFSALVFSWGKVRTVMNDEAKRLMEISRV